MRVGRQLLVLGLGLLLGGASLPGESRAEVRALMVVGASPVPIGSTRVTLAKEQAIEEGLWEGVVRVARDLVDAQAPPEVPALDALNLFWPGLPGGEIDGPLLPGLREEPEPSDPPASPLLGGGAPMDPDSAEAGPALSPAEAWQLSEEEAARLEARREAERSAEEAEVQRLKDALGRETVPYTKSFRIVEDQGERPALFTSDPDIANEYVVVMEVQVEVERVRARLEEKGLLTPLEISELKGVRLEVRGLTHYGGYRALVELLEGEAVGAEGVIPRDFYPGRMVLAVEGDWAPAELLERLRAAAPENLRIEAVVTEGAEDEAEGASSGPPTLQLEVAWAPPALPPPVPDL